MRLESNDASNLPLQVQAIAIGFHQLLLTCAADNHALLALKAFHPSQRPAAAAVSHTLPHHLEPNSAANKPARPPPRRGVAKGVGSAANKAVASEQLTLAVGLEETGELCTDAFLTHVQFHEPS